VYSDSEDSTEDVAWEDGTAPNDNGPNSSPPTLCIEGNKLLNDGAAGGVSDDRSSILTGKRPESPLDSVEKHSFSDFNHDNRTLGATDALKQAEVTASNLTDWAGRAFRRALKEADQSARPDSQTAIAPEAQTVSLLDDDSDSESVSSEWQKKGQTLDTMNAERRSNKISGKAAQGSTRRTAGGSRECGNIPMDSINWNAIRSQHEKETDAISEEMLEETKLLLRLFGIPYVEAPAEAEAQCAAMEKLGLVDGVGMLSSACCEWFRLAYGYDRTSSHRGQRCFRLWCSER
jgi:uncharacterized membrane protein